MPEPNWRAALIAQLSPDRLALLTSVQTLAVELGTPTYLVGGFVRDLLLGRPPGDFDFAVVPSPAAARPAGPRLARALAAEFGGTVTEHAAFGTATWHDPAGAPVDCATTRTETYAQPGALPSVTPAAAIETDLARRDFTINALALRVDGEHLGELVDPYAGRADLEARQVRVLHAASFSDDPTRLFRAVRYTHRLEFEIAADTLDLLPLALPVIPLLSGERLRHEFDLLMREPAAPAALAHLGTLGALAAVHPALAWTAAETERAAALAEPPKPAWQLGPGPHTAAAYYALLLSAAPGAAPSALDRLAVTRELAEAVNAALAFQPEALLAATQPSDVVAALDWLPAAALLAVYTLHPAARPVLDRYLSTWRFVRAELTGADLIALGLPAGPAFKTLLWQLRAGRLDGTLTTRAAELALARRWVEAG